MSRDDFQSLIVTYGVWYNMLRLDWLNHRLSITCKAYFVYVCMFVYESVCVGVNNAQQIEPLLETLYLNVRTECQIYLTWPHSLDEFAKLSRRLSQNRISNQISPINRSLFMVPLNLRDSLNDSYSSRARQTEQERVSEWEREREWQGFI